VPGPALAVLLLLSVLHFAEGEAAFDRLRGAPPSALPGLAVATSIVALPVARRPEDVGALVGQLSPPMAAALASGVGRTALVAAALLALAAGLRSADRTGRIGLALVVALALTAPPLVAFAAWFAGWHALRHLARVSVDRPLAPVLRASVLPSLAAVVAALAIAVSLAGVGAAVLLVLLALTVPHAVVVATVLPPAGRTLSGPGRRARPAGSGRRPAVRR
jgi:beta-carotene 15,15'-dioxygenase